MPYRVFLYARPISLTKKSANWLAFLWYSGFYNTLVTILTLGRWGYCLKSILSPMYSRNHCTTKMQATLLKIYVSQIALFRCVGILVLVYSCNQVLGQCTVLKILFNVRHIGTDNSMPNSLLINLGKSLGTPDFGFLASLIFSRVSHSVIVGGVDCSCNFIFSKVSTCSEGDTWSVIPSPVIH